MKLIIALHSLLALIMCSSAFGANNVGEMADSEFSQYLENPKGDVSRKDHLYSLIEVLRRGEKLSEKRRVDVVFTLLDRYVPRESMYAWKGDTFLDLDDMVEYLLTRDKAELETWLLDREIMIYDTATRNFRLQVKGSTFTKVENRGIRTLSVDELFSAFEIELSKREKRFDINQIRIVQVYHYKEWIAVCLYSDANGASRMACMISPEFFVHDIRKGESGF
jgi:hypothetical protein